MTINARTSNLIGVFEVLTPAVQHLVSKCRRRGKVELPRKYNRGRRYAQRSKRWS